MRQTEAPSATAFPQRYFVLLSVLLSAVIWAVFLSVRTSEYEERPLGDSAYYTGMSYSFFEPHAGSIPVSAIHSKRILGPFLVAMVLKLEHWDTGPPLEFKTDERGVRRPWSPAQAKAYAEIHHLWQVLNALSFVGLGAALALLIPKGLPLALKILVLANLLLTPSLSVLNILQPQSQDLLALTLFSAALLLLRKSSWTAGLALVGLSALAREEMWMLLPVIYLFKRLPVGRGLLLAGGPYLLVTLFPRFTNIVPPAEPDLSSAGSSAVATYIGILAANWYFFSDWRGLAEPVSILLNFGTSLVLLSAFERWRELSLLIVLCVILVPDRHMVPLNLIALFILDRYPTPALNQNGLAKSALWALLTFKVTLLAVAQNALWLEAVAWFRIMPEETYRNVFMVPWLLGLGWAAIVLVAKRQALFPIYRRMIRLGWAALQPLLSICRRMIRLGWAALLLVAAGDRGPRRRP